MAGENKEKEIVQVEKTAFVSPVAEVLAKFAESISRINNLSEAKDLLKEAKKMDLEGNKQESKEMIEKIFGKLFQIKNGQSQYDSVAIQKAIQKDQSAEKITEELIEKFNSGTETKRIITADPNKKEMLDSLEIFGEKLELTDEEKEIAFNMKALEKRTNLDADSKKRIEKVKNKQDEFAEKKKRPKAIVEKELRDLATRHEKEETDFLKELEEFIEGTNNAEISSSLKDQIKEAMQIGVFSKEKTRKSVMALNEKFKNYDFKNVSKEDKVTLKDLGNVLGGLRDGSVGEKVIDLAQKTKGSQATMVKVGLLMEGLDKVARKVDEGANLRDAVIQIEPREFEELRSFLASMQEKNKDLGTATYYDEKYAEMIRELGFNSEEENGVIHLLEQIKTQKEQIEDEKLGARSNQMENTPDMGRRGGRNSTFRPTVDAEGNVIDTGIGMENALGASWDHDTVQAQYDKSMDNLKKLIHIDDNGVGHAIDVRDEIQNKIMEHRKAELEYHQRGLQSRESLLNIDMEALFKIMAEYDRVHGKDKNGNKLDTTSNPEGYNLLDMIDRKARDENGITKLKDEVMFAKDRKAITYFENWWRQEALFEVRRMAYEGVFEKRNQSLRMLKWNSMNEILGVSTAMKAELNWRASWFGVIDQQNNSLANQEMFMNHAKFFGSQGVDFRLEHSLKVNREEICLEDDGQRGEVIGTVSMFDALTFQQLTVGNSDPLDKEIRKIAGMPDSVKDMTYGTLLNKYAEGDLRGKLRRAIWERFATAELGTGLEMGDKWRNLSEDNKIMIFERYSNQFEAALNYASTHQMLHTMIGNASFMPGKVELPAALAEGHLKNDLILYRNLFVQRFDALGQRLPELFAYYDSGLRDHVTLAREEYAGIYLGLGFAKEIKGLEELRRKIADKGEDTAQIDDEIKTARESLNHSTGSPTIFNGLLGKKAGELINDKDVDRALILNKIFTKSLFHWGKEVHRGHGHADPIDDLGEWGVTGDDTTAFRRRAQDIREQLRSVVDTADPSILDAIGAIDWKEYCKNFGDPRLEDKMKALGNDAKAKWLLMANTWGDASFKFDSTATKRAPDHIIKYSQDYAGKFQQDFLAWMATPNREELEAKLNEQVNSINSGAVQGLQEKRALALMGYTGEVLGNSWLGGGRAKVVKRDKTSRKLIMSKTKVGANGFPMWEEEVVKNNGNPLSPNKTNTAFSRFGIGKVGREAWMRRLEGYYTLNYISEDKFKKMYRHLQTEPFHVGKNGYLVYGWKMLTGEPLFEFFAPYLGITSHELRHILLESGEKTLNTLTSEIFGIAATGGGGGGHH